MTRPCLRMLPACLLGSTLLTGALAAQGEKITLTPRPAPNQVIRVGMTQNMAFDIVADGLPNGPMKIEGITAFQITQRIGSPDGQGRITGQLRIDSMTIAMLANGSPMPAVPMDSLLGQTMTVVYDADGKLIDVQTAGLPAVAADGVKSMLGQFAGSLPNAALAIGDTVSSPLSMAIPIPNLGMGPTNLAGRNLFRLRAIDHDGGDRIAKLEITTDATMSGTIVMHMTGTGTLDWNVDKGFLKNGGNEMKVEMTMTMPGMGGTMHLTGTIRMTITGESRAP